MPFHPPSLDDIHLSLFDILGRKERLSDPTSKHTTAEGRLGTVEDRKQRPRLAAVRLALQHLPTRHGGKGESGGEGRDTIRGGGGAERNNINNRSSSYCRCCDVDAIRLNHGHSEASACPEASRDDAIAIGQRKLSPFEARTCAAPPRCKRP